MPVHPHKRRLLLLLGCWLFFLFVILNIAMWNAHPAHRAVIGMGTGLVAFWCVLGGALTWRYRDVVRQAVQRLRWPWPVTFVLFATLLACIEEAITTSMTNMAPLFGVPMGTAYITASANFLDVIARHSVVVFVPMFIAWAWLLSRYAFSPFWVFVLFGITGTLAEASFGGQHQLGAFAMWIFVYGLMVYLPAYSIASRTRPAVSPRWFHAILAIFLPIIAGGMMALLLKLLDPTHPDIHFPPLQHTS